ncbi:MAG: transglutaminase-like domain-containing protein [Gemmatimonadales bacterium]
MTRRHWAIGILTAWLLSLGWLVKREVFQSTSARIAEAALAVPPGALFYRLDIGGQQAGFVSSTLDTLGDSIRLADVYVLDVAALGRLHRTSARSVAILSRTLRLRHVTVTFDGDIGRFDAHGRVLGDSILRVAIVSDGDSQVTRMRLSGPITLPTLLPLRLAFGGELEEGRTYTARLFDPLLLASRDLMVRVAAESTLIVADSADLDSTTMVWLPELFDTVRAFRIDQTLHGVPLSHWIDAQGRLVRASNAMGFAMERSAFEIAYENFRRRDTARVARASVLPPPPGHGEIVPLTAVAAGVRDLPPSGPPRDRLRLRVSGVDRAVLAQWTDNGGRGRRRQSVRGDTLEIVREGAGQARATPYRLPAPDTGALAPWLQPEPLIQSRDPRIAAQARLILNGRRERDPARAAERLARWVHGHVRGGPPPAAGAPPVVPSAYNVLERGEGDCNAAATLYVALARAAGLPARTVSGLIYLDGRFYYHAWAEVHLADWVAVDPAFGQYPADASHVRLVIGGLARHAELVPILGRLTLEVL